MTTALKRNVPVFRNYSHYFLHNFDAAFDECMATTSATTTGYTSAATTMSVSSASTASEVQQLLQAVIHTALNRGHSWSRGQIFRGIKENEIQQKIKDIWKASFKVCTHVCMCVCANTQNLKNTTTCRFIPDFEVLFRFRDRYATRGHLREQIRLNILHRNCRFKLLHTCFIG